MAAGQNRKDPVSKVVDAAVDTTKSVGTAAGDVVGAVSDTTSKATVGVTGSTGETTKSVGRAAGDVVGAVSDTTVGVAKTVTGTTGDAVEAVSNTVTAEEASSDDIK
jgi:hypothetical protein